MTYTKISLKPLSVNEAWKGRRLKSHKYNIFERSCLLMLPFIKVESGKLELSIHFGFSSKGSDLDNPTKMIIDILSKKYNFNDNMIYKITLTKEIVSKGNEFFEFAICNVSK